MCSSFFYDVFVKVERWGLDFDEPLTATEEVASQSNSAFSFSLLFYLYIVFFQSLVVTSLQSEGSGLGEDQGL